ncbi:MAG: hypothetical protein JNM32_10125 [Dechloromonas sp.]|nr:hypothetical protein [Dechloromonas sp.]
MTEQDFIDAGVVEFDSNGEPYIINKPGHLPDVCDAEVYYLAKAHQLEVFTRAGGLAKIYPATERVAGVKRDDGACTIRAMTSPHLREVMGRAVRHKKHDARRDALVPTDCSRAVADTLLERGYFPGVRPLEGFLGAPTITRAARIIDLPGWDQETGLYLAAKAIAGYDRPTDFSRKAAAQAVAYLNDLFKTFPFCGEADRCAMLAAVLTAIVRQILPTAPLLLITAPTPGTGKSKLSEAIGIIVTGRKPAVVALGQDDAETEKRLGGVFLAGDQIILIDNVVGLIRGVFLCQIATQPTVKIRPMGTSAVLDVPTNSTVILNGNNLTLVGDIQRRVMSIGLDAKMERPELRHFDGDFLEGIRANRGPIVRAALTIIGAYVHAGSPTLEDLLPFGSFEEWDAMCRRPLVWLGLPDPLASAEALRDSDPDLEAIRMLMDAWRAKFASDWVRLADVVDAAMARTGDIYHNPDLYDSLQIACSEKPNSKRLGNWLRKHHGRIVDSALFVKSGPDSHSKVAKWRLSDAGSAGSCGI